MLRYSKVRFFTLLQDRIDWVSVPDDLVSNVYSASRIFINQPVNHDLTAVNDGLYKRSLLSTRQKGRYADGCVIGTQEDMQGRASSLGNIGGTIQRGLFLSLRFKYYKNIIQFSHDFLLWLTQF